MCFPKLDSLSHFRQVIVSLVYADDTGSRSAYMIQNSFNYLQPRAKFLKASCNDAAAIVKYPIFHAAFHIKILFSFAKPRHDSCWFATDLFAGGRKDILFR